MPVLGNIKIYPRLLAKMEVKTITGVPRMTKKTILCVLVLAITGMLCAPVAAELHNEGDWSFYIVDHITAITDVEINGQSDSDAMETQCIHVPASLDHVSVLFDVTGGPDTNLTITREYIDMLREKYPGMEPVLFANGGFATYDVDSGGITPGLFTTDYEYSYYEYPMSFHEHFTGVKIYTVTIHEHLENRGAFHATLEKPYRLTANADIYNRFVAV